MDIFIKLEVMYLATELAIEKKYIKLATCLNLVPKKEVYLCYQIYYEKLLVTKYV